MSTRVVYTRTSRRPAREEDGGFRKLSSNLKLCKFIRYTRLLRVPVP